MIHLLSTNTVGHGPRISTIHQTKKQRKIQVKRKCHHQSAENTEETSLAASRETIVFASFLANAPGHFLYILLCNSESSEGTNVAGFRFERGVLMPSIPLIRFFVSKLPEKVMSPLRPEAKKLSGRGTLGEKPLPEMSSCQGLNGLIVLR